MTFSRPFLGFRSLLLSRPQVDEPSESFPAIGWPVKEEDAPADGISRNRAEGSAVRAAFFVVSRDPVFVGPQRSILDSLARNRRHSLDHLVAWALRVLDDDERAPTNTSGAHGQHVVAGLQCRRHALPFHFDAERSPSPPNEHG